MFLSYRTQNWVVDDDISNNWSVPPFVLFSANGSRVLRRKKTIRLREKTNEENFRGPCASNLLHLLCNTERRWSKQLVLSCVKLPSLLEAAARSWDPATYKGNICLDTSVPYAHFFGFMPHRGGVGWSGVECREPQPRPLHCRCLLTLPLPRPDLSVPLSLSPACLLTLLLSPLLLRRSEPHAG